MRKRYLTVDEYAELRGVTPGYIRRLAAKGDLPGAEKRGAQWFIPIIEPQKDEAPMRTLTIFNQAGGTGKTTLTMNLGYHFARRGFKVLLVDMDPQATLTNFMGLEPGRLRATIYDSLTSRKGDRSPRRPLAVHRGIHGMDLVPANILLAGAEQELLAALNREARLRRALDEVRAAYDLALIDAPPSLGMLSILSLAASDGVIVPIQTHFKAYLGTDQLLSTVRGIQEEVNQNLRILGFVPMQFARQSTHDRDVLEALEKQLQTVAPVLPPIPMATAFKKASVEFKPLAAYDPRHRAVAVLEQITDALLEALGGDGDEA